MSAHSVPHADPTASRRRFLRFLASSPLVATAGGRALAQGLAPDAIITDPSQAPMVGRA